MNNGAASQIRKAIYDYLLREGWTIDEGRTPEASGRDTVWIIPEGTRLFTLMGALSAQLYRDGQPGG